MCQPWVSNPRWPPSMCRTDSTLFPTIHVALPGRAQGCPSDPHLPLHFPSTPPTSVLFLTMLSALFSWGTLHMGFPLQELPSPSWSPSSSFMSLWPLLRCHLLSEASRPPRHHHTWPLTLLHTELSSSSPCAVGSLFPLYHGFHLLGCKPREGRDSGFCVPRAWRPEGAAAFVI